MFLLDNSVFTTRDSFEQSKLFARDLVGSLAIGMDKTRVGVASIAFEGTPDIYLSSFFDKGQLMLAIENINYQGATADLPRALEFIERVMYDPAGGARPRFPKVLFVITSDLLLEAQQVVQPAAQALKSKETIIYVAAYGLTVNRGQLPGHIRRLASDPFDRHSWILDDARGLLNQRQPILTGLCRAIPGKA